MHGPATFAAVDLGASSGRVVVGEVGRQQLTYREVHRFSNVPVELPTGLHWDVLRLYADVLDGLALAGRDVAASGAVPGTLAGIGIDSWAIDYALLDARGELLANPYSYRDGRTAGRVAGLPGLDATELHAINGLQHLPFTTIYQLASEPHERLARAATLLQLPDLLCHWLTGSRSAEVTNASTTGLLDATTREWSAPVLVALGIDAALLAPLVAPGRRLGTLRAEIATRTTLPASTPVYSVGSHDTASAVVAIPATTDTCAFISCGTWSLVGMELDRPVLGAAARSANFTNELGVDGRVRFLRNVTGLWLLQQCEAEWQRIDASLHTAALVADASRLPAGGPVFDVDAPVFLPPGAMVQRIADECRRSGQPVPESPAEVTRSIIDSLAAAFARTVGEAAALSGRPVTVVHLVGGGARNALLCQLTADACGLPVVAGPVEATAIGNLLVQARAAGAISGDLATLRALVRSTHELRTYEPAG